MENLSNTGNGVIIVTSGYFQVILLIVSRHGGGMDK